MSSIRCIICRVVEKNGKIVHLRNCPDYANPNHTTEVNLEHYK